MSERPQRHVYINDDTHVKYGETNEKQGYCLTCEQFSPCSHNALIDQYEAWEKENPRLERLDFKTVWESFEKFLEPHTSSLRIKEHYAINAEYFKFWVEALCQTHGQPKDAVSVDFDCIQAFIHDRFSECIREVGAVNVDDYERAKYYVYNCMRFLKSDAALINRNHPAKPAVGVPTEEEIKHILVNHYWDTFEPERLIIEKHCSFLAQEIFALINRKLKGE